MTNLASLVCTSRKYVTPSLTMIDIPTFPLSGKTPFGAMREFAGLTGELPQACRVGELGLRNKLHRVSDRSESR